MLARSLLFALLAVAAPPAALAQQRAVPGPGEQQLAAAEAAMNIGDDRNAEGLLSRVPPRSLDLSQLARAQLLRARISFKRGQPAAALQNLPPGSAHVAPALGEQIEQLRGSAMFKLGDPVGAVRALCLRERYLQGDSRALAENRDAIWQGLMQTRLPREAGAAIAAQEPIVRGWLELAWLAQNGGQRYDDWRARYPDHPALPRLSSIRSQLPAYAASGAAVPPSATAMNYAAAGGNGYALLLPMSGAYAPMAEAVRDGFISAYQAAQGGAQPTVRIYDTGTTPERAFAAYRDALAGGAGVIIGPLAKDAVTALAHSGAPPVPLLALNYLEAGTAPPNFLQLGVAPEDEARAAALQAAARNQLRAAVLVPSGDWGNRTALAFETQLRALGGSVVSLQRFEAGAPDHSKAVRRLLDFEASENRHKALSNVLGKQTEFEARRRNDIDLIFLAAKPGDARTLLPLLRFYHAGSLPLYATSLINEGRVLDDMPVTVCDMPWMLEGDAGPWGMARQSAQSQYPLPMRDYPRLFALGGDAYRIASRLHGGLASGTRLDGASGRLVLGADGRIGRELSCAALQGRPASASAR